jgi:hypothetical protein
MNDLAQELKRLLESGDNEGLLALLTRSEASLPLPGQDQLLDRAMWQASQFVELSAQDKASCQKVSQRLLSGFEQAISLKELAGQGKQAALSLWQDMLGALSWQALQPVEMLRSGGTQMLSLGTIEGSCADAKVQLNLGFNTANNNLKLLVLAKDESNAAVPGVECSLLNLDQGVVFLKQTNEDGSIVAPQIALSPGNYQIELSFSGSTVITPVFSV